MNRPPAVEALLLMADLVLTFTLLKGTIVVLVALAAERLWQGSSAADRAALWGATLAVLLLVPLAGLALPLWDLQLLAFPQLLWRWPDAAAPVSTATGGSLPLAVWLAWVWLAGAIGLLSRFLLGLWQARRALRRGAPADERSHRLVREAADSLRLRRRVRLVETTAITSPASLGWRRPVVLLPGESRFWPEARLRAVLLHELAHVQRGDWPVLVALQVARAVFWINPIVWYAMARLRFAQDRAADDVALRAGIPSASYAQSLLEVARLTLRPPLATNAFAFVRGAGLRARVEHVLSPTAARRATGRTVFALLVLVAVSGAGALGTAQLWRCESDRATPTILVL